MSFTLQTLATIGGQPIDAPTVYTYKSADALAVVSAAGYFDAKKLEFEEGDIIRAFLSDGSVDLFVGSDTSGAAPPAPAEISDKTLFISNADVVVANTVVETSVIGTGAGTVTIPAASLKLNTKFIIMAQGIISDTANPTFQLRVKLDSTLIGDSGANALGAISNDHWFAQIEFVVRSVGVTGTIMASGGFLTSQNDHFAIVNTSVITIDTTVDQILDLTVEWGTANAANTVTAQILQLKQENV